MIRLKYSKIINSNSFFVSFTRLSDICGSNDGVFKAESNINKQLFSLSLSASVSLGFFKTSFGSWIQSFK